MSLLVCQEWTPTTVTHQQSGQVLEKAIPFGVKQQDTSRKAPPPTFFSQVCLKLSYLPQLLLLLFAIIYYYC